MPAKKVCATSGCPRLVPKGTTYCPTHTRECEGRRGSATQRGYGQEHRALRADWQARIAGGQPVTCARCGHPIRPGEPWDLGHNDTRTAWTGPEHANSCNRSAAGRVGAAITNRREV